MAARHKIEVLTDSDEREEIRLDGATILGTNHDEHGWSGMRVARDVAQRIAQKMGWDFVDGVPMEEPE